MGNLVERRNCWDLGRLRHERFCVFRHKSESNLKERKLGIKGRNFYENRFQSCESEMKVLVLSDSVTPYTVAC